MAEKGLYALRRRKGLWQVVFDGQAGQFKHEKGAEYVARLLVERGPIHALELAAKAGGGGVASPGGQAGRTRKRRAEASLREVMEVGGRIQERSPALDDNEARQRLLDYRRRCERVVMNKNVSESSRAAAQRDLDTIVKFLRSQPGRPTNNAQRAARAVRMAIKRFHHSLSTAVDARGKPDRVLAAFAAHLQRHLVIPSARYSSPRARKARGEMAGSFVYEAPAGVGWKT
jgi:hypothetical protein